MSDVITLDGLRGYKSCSRSLVLQSIRFDRQKWTVRRARAWLKRKRKRAGKLDATPNQHYAVAVAKCLRQCSQHERPHGSKAWEW